MTNYLRRYGWTMMENALNAEERDLSKRIATRIRVAVASRMRSSRVQTAFDVQGPRMTDLTHVTEPRPLRVTRAAIATAVAMAWLVGE